MNKKQILTGVIVTAIAAASVYVGMTVTQTPDLIIAAQDVVITQSGTPTDYFDVTCSGAVRSVRVRGSYVRLHDCEVTGSVTHAIRIGTYPTATDVHHVIVENVTVHNAVTENGIYPACGTMGGGGWGSGIKAEKGSHDIIIRNNNVYDNCGEGIAATMAWDVKIENNRVVDNFSVNIYVDNAYRVTVDSNQIACTGEVLRNGKRPLAIAIGEENYAGWGQQLNDIRVTGNTGIDCHEGVSVFAGEFTSPFAGSIIIDNNNFPTGIHTVAIGLNRPRACPGIVVTNNIVWRLPVYTKCTGAVMANNVLPSPTPLPATATRTPVPTTATRTATPVITVTWTISPAPTATRTPAICYAVEVGGTLIGQFCP